MFKYGKLSAITVGAALFSVHCAFAAVVTPTRGVTLVNEGKGFVKISSDVEVTPGTKVMVRHGGSAMIYYGNNCSAEVSPGSVSVVREDADCLCDGAGGLKDGGGVCAPPPVSSDMWLIAGGMAVADAVAIGAAVSRSDGEPTVIFPVSP
jgi:hypothetical protein